jgi:cellulose synthase/poly-beta-1,6-N-acetylglucosamine synthase-like glycosyltransferase
MAGPGVATAWVAAAAMPQVGSWWHQVHHIVPIGFVGAISWSVWLVRWTLSRLYRPVPNGFTTTTSVVVPSFREDPDILEQCLVTWLAEGPGEVIVVPDLADTEVINRLYACAARDRRLRVVPFAHRGKRSALGVGIRQARGEILVLSDSDTRWERGLLPAVLAPFADPRVGGVGTRQNAYLPKTSVWRRVADWMIDIRYLDYVRAQSRPGGVACLSGRTVAYRRAAVLPVVENLEDEFFLGRRCVAGDDGRLTWLVLASGYKTVYQANARALSMFPDEGRAFFKQRLRWSRNSYRTYLTAIWKGWLWRQPFVTQLSVLQILLTPVTMGFAMTYLAAWLIHPERWVAFIAVGWLLVGRGLRGISHLREKPGDIWLLPLVAILTIVIALPIKTYAFFTMNKHGWLTRNANQMGSEGQTAASLTRRLRAPVSSAREREGPGLAPRDRGPGDLRCLRLDADDPGRPERASCIGGTRGADVQPRSRPGAGVRQPRTGGLARYRPARRPGRGAGLDAECQLEQGAHPRRGRRRSHPVPHARL